MRHLARILTLAAALAATDATAQAQETDEQPKAGDDSGSGRRHQRRQRRRGGKGCCRNTQREERGGGCREGRGDRKGDAGQRGDGCRQGRGNRNGDAGQRRPGGGRGQGACAVGNVPKPTKPAKPEYIERLQKALASELYARDYYAAAAKSLKGVRRFSNLSGAEERHAKAIRSVITAFGGKPVEPEQLKVVAPKTLAQADEHCREIERKVIQFYEKLIADCPDEGIKQVLQRIQTANHRHLQAVGG